MDMYGGGFAKPEPFRIDDLLDLSNEEFFSSASGGSASSSNAGDQFAPPQSNFGYVASSAAFNPSLSSTDFTHELCVPSDDVAELEWLSRFVDDSFADFPPNSHTGTLTVQNGGSFHGKARGKRSSKSAAAKSTSSISNQPENELSPHSLAKLKPKREAAEDGTTVRRCTHCASEKTPQWRTGPLGPKTLCNACGVRYKSGRLVPEYRPASSPSFVLTQHSNSHRKVMELRRQKEMIRQQQEQIYRHHHDFKVS